MHFLRPDGSAYEVSECPITLANQEGKSLTGHEDVFVRPDGRFYHVACNVAPLVHGGQTAGAIIDLRDSTEEKEAEEAIRQSMAIKDHFLGLVSHELRTPISAILGNALLLLRRADQLDAESRRQALTDVANESQRLERIIENLLLLTRVDAGEHIEAEPVRLPALVEHVVSSFQRRNPARPISVACDGDVPIALGQPTVLTLVLENLIGNADKYSPPEGPIEIRIRPGDREDIEVRVRDYGIGLGEGEATDVFTPFYRSDRARTQAKGVGLGLAVCKRVIEAQGGRIWALARPEGGCDFTFSLRRVDDQPG
jgi:two-component system sensor histidine kinase KdpD